MTTDTSTRFAGRLLRALYDPLAARPGSRWVFLAFCLAFWTTRLLVVDTAVDHLHNVDGAEMRLVEHAYYLLGDAPQYTSFIHLWGHRATALALAPLLLLGFSGTAAAKLLAIFISFVGGAAVVYLLGWKRGPFHAAVVAGLLLFPDAPFLKWTLTLWGAYPEATSLALVATAVWVAALGRDDPRWLAGAGAASGLTLAFSPSVLYLPLALAALTPFVFAREKRRAAGLWYAAGVVLGFSPWLIWLTVHGAGVKYQPFLASAGEPISILRSLAWPSVTRLAIFLRKMRVGDFPLSAIGTALVGVAVLWTTVRALSGKQRHERWVLVFPTTFVCGLVVVSMFTLIQDLEIRHALWLFPAMYACVALMLGDWLTWAAGRGDWKRAPALLLLSLVAGLVIFPGVTRIAHFVQLDQWGMSARFRGYQYYQHEIGSLVGDEVDGVNALLDSRPDLTANDSFMIGLRNLFPMSGHYRCCLWEPLAFDKWTLPNAPTDVAPGDFFGGVGCGMAIKSTLGREALLRWSAARAPEIGTALDAGFAACVSPDVIK